MFNWCGISPWRMEVKVDWKRKVNSAHSDRVLAEVMERRVVPDRCGGGFCVAETCGGGRWAEEEADKVLVAWRWSSRIARGRWSGDLRGIHHGRRRSPNLEWIRSGHGSGWREWSTAMRCRRQGRTYCADDGAMRVPWRRHSARLRFGRLGSRESASTIPLKPTN